MTAQIMSTLNDSMLEVLAVHLFPFCMMMHAIRKLFLLGMFGLAALSMASCHYASNDARPEPETREVVKEVVKYQTKPVPHIAFMNQEQPSIAVDYGKSIIVMDADMKKKYSLMLHPGKDDAVRYEWASLNSPKKSGSGKLIEKYEVDPNSPDGERKLIDAGSQKIIALPELNLSWSKRSGDSGWIYYGDSKAIVAVSLDHRASFVKRR